MLKLKFGISQEIAWLYLMTTKKASQKSNFLRKTNICLVVLRMLRSNFGIYRFLLLIQKKKLMVSLEIHNGDITGLEWTSTGDFITSSTNSPLVMWDKRGKIIHKWNLPRITSIAIDSGSNNLIVISGERAIHVIDLSTKLPVRIFKEKEAIVDIASSKIFPEIMVTYHSNEIRVKNIFTGKCGGKFIGHSHDKYVVQGGFGGKSDSFVATGSTDGKIYVWSKSSEELIEILEGHHDSPVACVIWNSFIPNLFASASDDGKICIWGAIQ
eukprot:NODE_3_length_80033_cov_0.932970.p33 type:complete len:269 gc:universal NODE_3_length_80033_cov_0.932970:26924-26118(-)